ncbi:hypothetical protein ACE1B6_00070 [Aerosakkonemataceae cyanobacterium BLCC-F154]|uniref:Uncharacterized protein n=1 Tax=Floridaenema fluviatile BLCC-F154 TaxID=3153640 RepID=A0ABV4Y4A2_9CYAN
MIDDHSSSSLVVPASTQDHSQGMLSAAVMLVMYGDYQCLRSAAVYKLIKIIRQEFTVSFGEDYLCFIFRHFPQIQIHPQAQRAAQAAVAAAAQGKFWGSPLKSVINISNQKNYLKGGHENFQNL